jgi:hypothetical protein
MLASILLAPGFGVQIASRDLNNDRRFISELRIGLVTHGEAGGALRGCQRLGS